VISDLDAAAAKPRATRAQKQRGVKPETTALIAVGGMPKGIVLFGVSELKAIATEFGLTPEQQRIVMAVAVPGHRHDGWVESPKLSKAWGYQSVLGHREFINFHEAVLGVGVKPVGTRLLFA
jgi:hypothetical protein